MRCLPETFPVMAPGQRRNERRKPDSLGPYTDLDSLPDCSCCDLTVHINGILAVLSSFCYWHLRWQRVLFNGRCRAAVNAVVCSGWRFLYEIELPSLLRGAIDEKRLSIWCPRNGGWLYFNSLTTKAFTRLLLAFADDDDYKFCMWTLELVVWALTEECLERRIWKVEAFVKIAPVSTRCSRTISVALRRLDGSSQHCLHPGALGTKSKHEHV